MKKEISLFLDSGAYSAMTQGVSIDIDEYISFIKKNKKYIDVYACLDVIGDPKQTYKNQLYMESKGLKPLIAFHRGEDYKWLQKYIDKYDYVALGGLAGKGDSVQNLQRHLDKCFEMICDPKTGMPKLKIHGFGVTSVRILVRYPWYSVDSTSWVLSGRFGGVLVPKKKNGKYDFYQTPHKIDVSDKSSSIQTKGKHITTFSPVEKKAILKYFKEKGYSLGKSERDGTAIKPGLCNDYKLRDELNIIYYLDLEEALPKWPWAWKPQKPKGFGLV